MATGKTNGEPAQTSAPGAKQDIDPPLGRTGTEDLGFLSSQQTSEKRSWLPWIAAASVVVLAVVLLLVFGRTKSTGASPVPSGTTGMAALDPYAAHLTISGLEMSQATSFSGAKVTYIDGQIANTGNITVTSVAVQVGFRNSLGQFSQRTSIPLSLIRTRQPYVDTEPVSAEPLAPGQRRDFRLIFDSLPDDWDQQYPEIRVVGVRGHS